jgi:HEAT repeat protein
MCLLLLAVAGDDVAKKPVANSKPVKDWVADLESPSRDVMIAALDALVSLGPKAKEGVPDLIKVIERDGNPARLAAIEVIGHIGPDAGKAIPILTKVLAHEDFHTQYFSVRALAKIGPESKVALPEIQRLLQSGVASARKNAATALGDLGPVIGEDGIRALVAALGDKVFTVREQAALALGKLGEHARESLPELRELAQKHSLSTRVAAAHAVWDISRDIDFVLPILIEETEATNHQLDALRALADIGPAAKGAVPRLVPLLRHADAEVQMLAADVLGAIGPDAKAARAELKGLLDHEEKDVRESAAAALKAIGN